MPSLRLLTSPAWVTADRSRSVRVVRRNTSRCVGASAADRCPTCWDSAATWWWVSRTRKTDSSRPAVTYPMPSRKGSGRRPQVAATQPVASAEIATAK